MSQKNAEGGYILMIEAIKNTVKPTSPMASSLELTAS
jgi:hypothetical protein